MRLAAILMLLVAGTHYGYDPIAAAFYKDQTAAARALFYAFRGIEGAALFLVVGLLARRPLVLAVCLWGVLEEGQTAVCRLARGIENVPVHEAFQGLCGSPMYGLGLMIAACLAIYWLDRGTKK